MTKRVFMAVTAALASWGQCMDWGVFWVCAWIVGMSISLTLGLALLMGVK
jgi:hypothetical protein